MGKPKIVKPKEERLNEGITLLKQLKEAGVKEHSLGFVDLKQKVTEWINSDTSWEGVIEFREYGRIAEVDLPKYNNRAAGINFKVKKIF